jgi:hypothetical protein
MKPSARNWSACLACKRLLSQLLEKGRNLHWTPAQRQRSFRVPRRAYVEAKQALRALECLPYDFGIDSQIQQITRFEVDEYRDRRAGWREDCLLC